jgi:predicted dehydrogenase
LQATTAAGLGFWVAGGVQARQSKSPNERIQFASIGITGKGSSDSEDAAAHGDMVAICDADETFLAAAERKFGHGRSGKKPKKYTDFRKMLEEMGKKIDAVTVSTPDHVHALAAAMAMKMGKHCFCQKPLTHTICEARRLAEIAREKGVATQMGNQGTASDSLREAAAILRAQVVGNVSEVHIWTNRPIWPQGGARPTPEDPPKHLKWDLWLGPAPVRPYGKGYHPFAWRGWWDFGTGALGDMACHTVNMPYMGLELRDPTWVQAKTSGHNRDSYPKWSVIDFQFPANSWRGPLKMAWYDGGERPPARLFQGVLKENEKQPEDRGCLVIGDKGKLYSPGDYAEQPIRLSGVSKPTDLSYPKSPGHFEEWVRAIKGGEPAMSNFPNYSGRLTEVILLGNLAVWAANEGEGKRVEWDAQTLKATNAPEVQFIVQTGYPNGYRKGYRDIL